MNLIHIPHVTSHNPFRRSPYDYITPSVNPLEKSTAHTNYPIRCILTVLSRFPPPRPLPVNQAPPPLTDRISCGKGEAAGVGGDPGAGVRVVVFVVDHVRALVDAAQAPLPAGGGPSQGTPMAWARAWAQRVYGAFISGLAW